MLVRFGRVVRPGARPPALEITVPRRALPLATTLAALALVLAGCGDDDGSSGDRPSVEEVSKKLASSGQITEDQADCVAAAFVDSDISDDGLQTLLEEGGVAGMEQADISAEDRAAVEAATQEVIACATDGIEDDLATTTAPAAGGETTTTAAG